MSNNRFPSPAKIMAQYPKYPGEYCNQADNECAIRISISLHKNDIDISESETFRKTHQHNNILHQPSVQALADWLSSSKRLGRPKVYEKPKGQQWKK